MANLSKGSTGSSVRELQTLLNSKGYNLTVDGIFGDKTLAAVRDYQGKNGLTVDGIAGANTMASLNGTGTGTGGGANTQKEKSFAEMTTSEKVKYLENNKVEKPQELIDLENNKPGEYKPSDAVNQALKELEDFRATKPGDYESRYDPQIQDLLNQINNKEPFSYDFTKDPMYAQYKDEYTNNAKLAMMDTMGEAASLTGGYGSSYASTVGQQAYQGQMRQLATDIIPELWNMSYQVYKDNEQSLYNQLAAFQTQDAAEYQRYADQLDAWYNDLNFLYNKWGKMSDDDYQYYVNNLEQWNKDRGYLYQQWRDDQSVQQGELEYWNNKAMEEAALAAASSSGSGGSGRGRGRGNGGGDDNDNSNGYTLDPQNVAAQSPSFADEVLWRVDNMSSKGDDWKSYLDSEYSKGNITWDQHESIRKDYNDTDKTKNKKYNAF